MPAVAIQAFLLCAGYNWRMRMDKLEAVNVFWEGCDAVEQVPGKAGGELVFRGSRTPVSCLWANLGEMNSEEFASNYFVDEQDVEMVLDHMVENLKATTLACRSPQT